MMNRLAFISKKEPDKPKAEKRKAERVKKNNAVPTPRQVVEESSDLTTTVGNLRNQLRNTRTEARRLRSEARSLRSEMAAINTQADLDEPNELRRNWGARIWKGLCLFGHALRIFMAAFATYAALEGAYELFTGTIAVTPLHNAALVLAASIAILCTAGEINYWKGREMSSVAKQRIKDALMFLAGLGVFLGGVVLVWKGAGLKGRSTAGWGAAFFVVGMFSCVGSIIYTIIVCGNAISDVTLSAVSWMSRKNILFPCLALLFFLFIAFAMSM